MIITFDGQPMPESFKVAELKSDTKGNLYILLFTTNGRDDALPWHVVKRPRTTGFRVQQDHMGGGFWETEYRNTLQECFDYILSTGRK